MAEENAELARVKYGAVLIGVAFAILLTVLILAISRFSTAADVTAVVGAVTSVVGTVIGAFFGVQVGSSGKEDAVADKKAAMAERETAERTARIAMAKLDPSEAEAVLWAIEGSAGSAAVAAPVSAQKPASTASEPTG